MKVFCIISDERVFQSKSPAMFSAIFKRVGIRSVYVPFNVNPEQVGPAMQSLRVLNIDGANIAAPYKEAVIPHMDILSEGANIIGAINTIVRNGDELKGYNTNAIGFMDCLDEVGFDVTGKTALVFGGGGSAKAVVFILNWLRAESIVKTEKNKDDVLPITNSIGGEAKTFESLLGQKISANIIINATSFSSPDESPELAAITKQLDIKDCELLIDLNYGRDNNFWEDMAKAKGIRFIDGLHPLAYQARRCFTLWTRIDVEPLEFIKALEAVL